MTRFYLGTVATVPSISPTPNAEWDNTTGFIRRLAFPSAQATAFSNTQTTDSATGKTEWKPDESESAKLASVIVFGALAAFLVYIGSRKEAEPGVAGGAPGA